jgi:hypothetical protein
VSQLGAVLEKIMVKRKLPALRRSKHLCADAGYAGEPALKLIELHGYIPHVKGRGQEKLELEKDSNKKARRWVVEVAHSWFMSDQLCVSGMVWYPAGMACNASTLRIAIVRHFVCRIRHP